MNARQKRTFAEWISFSFSLLIVLALGTFLGARMLEKEKTYFSVEAKALFDDGKRADGKYILPIQVSYPKGRTFAKLTVRVTWMEDEKTTNSQDIELEYLAEKARQTTYLYFSEDPRNLKITVTPLRYTLE